MLWVNMPVETKACKNAEPQLAPGPSVEAIVNGGVWTIVLRTIPPPAIGLKNMHDAADHPAIIHSSCCLLSATPPYRRSDREYHPLYR
jgi:hypothetical protein